MRTISSSSDIDRLFRSGRRASRPLLVVLAGPTADGSDPRGRVVFIAGRKMGGAVTRNRCKRVLREACRRTGGPWEGWDVALIARSKAATASPAELDAALRGALEELGVGRP